MTTHAEARVHRVTGGAGTPPGSWSADDALEQLYAAHWRQLVRLAVLLVRDTGTAEEVVQDAFVSVHDRWSRIRTPDAALPYLRQAVVNRARSVLRHRGVVDRHLEAEAALPRTPAPDAETALLGSARRTAVLDAMRALPPRQREVLALRHFAELSEGEIATALGISRGAVKSHASRGSATLRSLLGPLLEEQP